LPTEIFGGVVFELTKTLAEFVHPLDGSTTVKVYVPAVLTVPLDEFEGDTPLLH
jgi:hypothetical protein